MEVGVGVGAGRVEVAVGVGVEVGVAVAVRVGVGVGVGGGDELHASINGGSSTPSTISSVTSMVCSSIKVYGIIVHPGNLYRTKSWSTGPTT